MIHWEKLVCIGNCGRGIRISWLVRSSAFRAEFTGASRFTNSRCSVVSDERTLQFPRASLCWCVDDTPIHRYTAVLPLSSMWYRYNLIPTVINVLFFFSRLEGEWKSSGFRAEIINRWIKAAFPQWSVISEWIVQTRFLLGCIVIQRSLNFLFKFVEIFHSNFCRIQLDCFAESLISKILPMVFYS